MALQPEAAHVDDFAAFDHPGAFPDGHPPDVDGRAAIDAPGAAPEEHPNARYLREGAPFDLLLAHATLDVPQMAAAVPDAPFASVVRAPPEQFASAWDYFYGSDDAQLAAYDVYTDPATGARSNATLLLGGGVALSMRIETWAERAAFAARVDELGIDAKMSARLVNPSARQLGWPLRLPNGTAVHDVALWLAQLDETFDLLMVQVVMPLSSPPCVPPLPWESITVLSASPPSHTLPSPPPHLPSLLMVQEKWERSLLLLGLCLGLDDAQLVPPPADSAIAKTDAARRPSSSRPPLSPLERQAIERLSPLDLALHAHASSRLEAQLGAARAEYDAALARDSFAAARLSMMAPQHERPPAPASTSGALDAAADGSGSQQRSRPWWAARPLWVEHVQEEAKSFAERCAALENQTGCTAGRRCEALRSSNAVLVCESWRWSERGLTRFVRCLAEGRSQQRCFEANSNATDGAQPVDEPVDWAPLRSGQLSMTAARRGALVREPAWAGARVVVVSQGTTGTRAAFHALAALGLPTAHWVLEARALPLGALAAGMGGASEVDLSLTYSYAATDAQGRAASVNVVALDASAPVSNNTRVLLRPSRFEAHDRLMALYSQAADCAADPYGLIRRAGSPQQCLDEAWLAEVAAAVAIGAREGFSVSDVPWASFPSLLMAAPGAPPAAELAAERQGSAQLGRTLFVHLERDADDWARARLDPAHRSGPVCASALWHAVPGQPSPLVDNPLDLHACVAACLARGAAPCVVPMGTLGEPRLAAAYRRQAAAVDALLDALPTRNTLRLDLFERPRAVADLATELRHELCARGLVRCGAATAPALARMPRSVPVALAVRAAPPGGRQEHGQQADEGRLDEPPIDQTPIDLGDENSATQWVILPAQRVLLCHVEKNAGTTLMSLAHLAAGTPPSQLRVSCPAGERSCDATRWFWRGLSPAAQNVSVAALRDALSDGARRTAVGWRSLPQKWYGWRTAVVLRDPVERWVSAYKSKCEEADADGMEHCHTFLRLPYHRGHPPTMAAVAAALGAMPAARRCEWDPHWRPQSCFCSLNRTLPSFNERIPFESFAQRMRSLYEGRVPSSTLDEILRQAANLTAAPLHKLDGNHATNAHVSELDDLTRTQLQTLYHDDYALLKA